MSPVKNRQLQMVFVFSNAEKQEQSDYMQTLNQDIKNNDFKKVYLLFGEEAFLKKSYKNRLREAITQGDTMNYNYYEGKGINVNEIISLSEYNAFFLLTDVWSLWRTAAGLKADQGQMKCAPI